MGAIIFFVVLVSLVLYFLPTIIGYNKSFAMQLFLLNLFLGWTFIGWVIALVWAFKNENPPQIHVHTTPVSKTTNHDDVYTALEKLSKLHKDGIITDAEFAEQKRKLLA